MGIPAAGDQDQAEHLATGAFTATGAGSSILMHQSFNLSVWGTFVATLVLERSFDGGTTFLNCSRDVLGTDNAITAPMTIVCEEPEFGVLYRLRCSAFTSGTANWRLSQ